MGRARWAQDLVEHETLLGLGEGTGTSAIRTALGMKGGKAAFLVGVPPVFEGALGDGAFQAVGPGARGSSDRLQGDRKGQSLVEEVLDLGQEGVAVECDGFGTVLGRCLAHRRDLP